MEVIGDGIYCVKDGKMIKLSLAADIKYVDGTLKHQPQNPRHEIVADDWV